MSTSTAQLSTWTSTFGKEYTDRNTLTLDEMDAAFAEQFGVSKSAIYRRFVGHDRLSSGRVLEVGCNIGLQLRLLEKANPGLELHGLEPQSYAIERARNLAPHHHFHQGNAFALPFADGTYDLVFTHGVLIHIHPNDLPRALAEIVRVSRRFVLCHEYYAPDTVEIPYHGQTGLLWKTDFARRYLEVAPGLREVERQLYPYSASTGGSGLVDQVVLFEKVEAA
ncbi:MAG: pseudaminic acid biosynthesis-associated methylase [Gemmatimonadales bacterium]